ncbi:hypothetical protein LARI1_G001758 [Lachnellula arida]|uniref:Uncharacterized protein n=1 Tax=Lachnellula arida TaxID=1316785 RepID=A0A8T9BGI9_9HELO|nr:hypothetical protein LARI1_G001758 [Lachnellula arida]
MESKRKINAANAAQDEVERALKRRKVLSRTGWQVVDVMRLETCCDLWAMDLFRTNAPTDERGFFTSSHRPATRRRKADNIQDHIDLSKGESAELTTEHGLKLVDTLRRTEDKRQADSFPTVIFIICATAPRPPRQPRLRIGTSI